MNKTTVFTSNITKLLGNIDRLTLFQKTGILYPITLDVAPTNKCNQNCKFCSVRDRDKNKELTYEEVIDCTNYFYKKGILGIELTGGGEPTMWPHLAKYIDYCTDILHLKVGLITNGLKLHEFTQETLSKLSFLRVSLNGIDNNWFPSFKVPSNIVFSMNYVWHENSNIEVIRTTLLRILEQYPTARALKIQRDVFDRRENIGELFIAEPRVFFSQKTEERTPNKCYMGWLKPHLDADGYIYRCSCSATFNRKFQDQFRIGTLKDVADRPDADLFSTKECPYCYFAPQNKFVQQLIDPVEHKEFI